MLFNGKLKYPDFICLDAIGQNFVLFDVPFNEKSNISFSQYSHLYEIQY